MSLKDAIRSKASPIDTTTTSTTGNAGLSTIVSLVVVFVEFELDESCAPVKRKK